MKKVLLLTLVLSFGLTQVVWAEWVAWRSWQADKTGRWSAGVIVKGVFPDEEEDDVMASYGAVLEYNFTSILTAEIEASYTQEDEHVEGVKFAEVNYTPLLFNLKARYPKGRLKPFIFAGVGVMFVNLEAEEWIKRTGANIGVGTGLAYQMGGGIDYFIAENVAFYTRVGYLWSQVGAEAAVTGYSNPAKVELDHFFSGGGIKMLF